MKKTLLITFVFCLAATLQSQTVKIISKKDNSVINGTQYTIYGDAARPEIKEEFLSVMEGTDSVLVGLKRRELSTIPNTSDFYCWVLCYLPIPEGTAKVHYAPDSLVVIENDTVNRFSVYLNPSGVKGKACYQYVFQPETNPQDSSWVDICFDLVTVGVDQPEIGRIRIFPNPVKSVLNVDLSEYIKADTYVEIHNSTGQLTLKKRIYSGINRIDLGPGLSPGLYNARIITGNEVVKSIPVIVN